jgi:hypothetical protein
MKVSFNTAGTTFAVKADDRVRKHIPEGLCELRHVPFIHETDPSRSDQNAVEVWNKGVRIGYMPKGSPARAAFFEMQAEGVDINATVVRFLYAIYDGNLNIIDDTFNDVLDGYLASVEIEFEAAVTSTHYTIGGKEYIRATCVSGIIDEVGFEIPEHLYKWMTETDGKKLSHIEYLEKLEKTRIEGIKLHHACHQFVQFGVSNQDTPKGLDEIVAKFGVEFISAEQVVFDNQYKVAGRYDMLCKAMVKDEGCKKKIIMDWKRGSKIRVAYMLQSAFYAKKTGADGFWIVLFGGKNKCGYSIKMFNKQDIDTLYEVFMSLAMCISWLGEFKEFKLKK